MKSKLIIALSFLLAISTAKADTFIVTSNANAGVGSLREAITMANANGTAVMDFIQFNIPDQSEAGRTINLQAELPTLTSKITIDGTTQPGIKLGISNARITLLLDHFTSLPFTYFFIHNASAVSIYGICFKFFDNPNSGGGLNYAIGLRNAAQITVGAAGKGNLFSAVRAGITNNYWNYFNPDSAKDISIQNNVFGMNSNNQRVGGGLIDLKGAANITIGGPTAAEGNLHIEANIDLTEIGNSASAFFAKIQNNRVNVNWDGSAYYYFSSGSVILYGNAADDSLITKTWILDNIFCGSGLTGLGLFQLYHRVIIQGNKLGLDAAGRPCQYSPYDIGAWGTCKNLLIGGYTAAEQNIIHGSVRVPKHGVHVLQNQISQVIQNYSVAAPDPFIKITEYDNNLIRGVANNYAKIQLYTTECQTSTCFLKKYFGVTWADASGNWSFSYTAGTPNLIATATIADSSTSAFTEVKVDFLTYRVIKNATCGNSNGSITGIKIYEGTHISWYNNSNQLVGTDTNLVNVPAGTYYLRVSDGANGCVQGFAFSIYDISPPATLNPAPAITNASCGLNNGIINHTTYTFFRNIWYNNQMDSIGNGSFINNLSPGSYFLKLVNLTDTGCNKLYGPFIVANSSGPSLNTNAVMLTAATCSNNNGAITGITSNNVTGVPYIVWVNEFNSVFGNALNVANLPAGKYRLKFKDTSPCDTIITQYFIIINTGAIAINTNPMLVTGSDCGLANGSIIQIQASGATIFQWINAAGTIVGTGVDLTAVPPGKYVLKTSNSFGCAAQTDSITVPGKPFIPNPGTLQFASQPGKCDEKNGFYTVSNFPDPQLYNFYWVDSLQPATVVSTGLTLTGINSGTYFLYAKNAAGCEERIVTARIPYLKPVKPDATTAQIKSSTCNLGNGSITGLTNAPGTGQSPFTYAWYNTAQLVVSNQQQFVNAIAGNYRVVITDANSCTDTSNYFIIGNNNIALPKPVYQNQDIASGTATILTVQNPQAGGTYYFYDAANATIPIAQNNSGIFITPVLSQNTTYFIACSTGTCTSERTSVAIKVFTTTRIFVPNAFTPNRDGKNDLLKPLILGQAEIDYFTIYNKYGQIIFSSKDAAIGWDGMYKGSKQPMGTYVWIFKGKDKFTGNTIDEKGSFVLLK